jgi:hypothetical protein
MGLDELITSLNRSLAGWANYFRYGVSKATFSAIDHFTWSRLMRWIRAKYAGKHRLGMTALRRRFCDKEWRFACNGGRLHRRIQRRRDTLPLPRQQHPDPMDPGTGSRHQQLTSEQDTRSARCAERRTPGAGGDLRETDRWQHQNRARRSTSPRADMTRTCGLNAGPPVLRRADSVCPIREADMQQWAHAGVSGPVCCKAAVTTSGAGCNSRVLGAGYEMR